MPSSPSPTCSQLWAAACTTFLKSTQYLEGKALGDQLRAHGRAKYRTAQNPATPFLLGWRIAERRAVLEWRSKAIVVSVGSELFGERHALCHFDWGKHSLPSIFDLPVFNVRLPFPVAATFTSVGDQRRIRLAAPALSLCT